MRQGAASITGIARLSLAVMQNFTDFGALEPWLAAPDQVLTQLRDDQPGGEPALMAQAAAAGAGPAFPLFRAGSVLAGLYAADGRVIAQTPGLDRAPDTDIIAAVARTRAARVVSATTPAGMPSIRVYTPAGMTAGWHLPAIVRDAMTPAGDAVVMLTSEGSIGGALLEDAARVFGFSGLETRVVVATIETGSIKAAADRLDIAYQTAREAVAAAMRRAGVARLPALVTLLAEVSFGVLPEGGDDTSLLADAWGISPRQAMLGMLVASGLDRSEAAAASGLSDAVAKKEIERLYLALGVGSAAALARLVAEANAMQWMMRATAGGMGVFDSAREPLRYALRDDGSRVAWSDYGPASGRPVLVAHCSMTTRFVSRRLVRALQARGFRPISIDRPGFGLSDPLAGLQPGLHDPFEAAVADVVLVARQARVRRFDVVSRGAAHHLLALKMAAPDLVGRVVITNPDPASRSDPRRMGFLGAAKEAAMRRPGLIRKAAGLMAGVLTESNFKRIFARSVEGSPPDEAAMAEPDIIEDYWRAVRPFLTGRLDGYVNEQTQLATMAPAPPQPGTHDWHFMVAEHDVLYDPAWVMAYWRRVLPDATAELLPGGGRLMAMARADLIVDRLLGA